jgi:replicative DNA helicase
MMDLAERSLPVERALLGALLSDRDAIASVVERLAVEAFAHPWHRRLYRAIVDCWQRRVPPDVVTVRAVLDTDGGEPVDWASVAGLLMDAPYAVHAPHYADLVIAAARDRAISDAGAALVQAAHAGGDVALDARWSALQDDLAAFGAVAEAGPAEYASLIPAWRTELAATWDGTKERVETQTGFAALDRCTGGGFRPGELIVLGARPGMGKTALALQLAHQAADANYRHVLIFSAEMSTASLLLRSAAARAGLSYTVINRAGLDSRHRARVGAALDDLTGLPVAVDDSSGITTGQLQVRIERFQRFAPVGLVIFDYLELAGDTHGGDSEERRVGDIIRRMKHIAMTCRVPVLTLSQLNRSVENRAGFVPKLADLRYSGAIEANADIVLLLYRQDYYEAQGQITKPDEAKRGTADLIVAKHRNGPTPTIVLGFDAETMTFQEYGR